MKDKMMYLNIFDDQPGVTGFFTTVHGGVSPKPWASLNFGLFTDDAGDHVSENRHRVFSDLGIAENISVCPIQIHGSEIKVITEEDLKDAQLDDYGRCRQIIVPDTDGIATALPNVILTTLHADCAAVYLYDPKNRVVGLAHAGWRGTEQGIGIKTAQVMEKDLGASVSEMMTCISPCISRCCFETGEEVLVQLKKSWKFADQCAVLKSGQAGNNDKKYMIDLKELNRRQLAEIGVKTIEISEHCTCCESDTFYSYRREKGKTGRMAAGLCLTDTQ